MILKLACLPAFQFAHPKGLRYLFDIRRALAETNVIHKQQIG